MYSHVDTMGSVNIYMYIHMLRFLVRVIYFLIHISSYETTGAYIKFMDWCVVYLFIVIIYIYIYIYIIYIVGRESN